MRAIDADFIIQKLTDFGAKKAELDRDLYLLGGVIAIVDNAPTIETVKHGKWLRIGKQHIQEWQMMNKCSACGHAVTNSTYVDKVIYFKFCPHCGAEMGGTE